jgi:molybdate transport system ATP-binding protein
MNRPKLLLMDEPLSALDQTMRLKLQNEILILHKEFNTTTIMVSHDLSEIYKLSNRIIRLEYGKIISDEKAIEVVLKTKKSSNLSFEDEILNLIKEKMENFKIGDIVDINIKAFRST